MPPKFKRHLNDDEVTGSIRSERVRVRYTDGCDVTFDLNAHGCRKHNFIKLILTTSTCEALKINNKIVFEGCVGIQRDKSNKLKKPAKWSGSHQRDHPLPHAFTSTFLPLPLYSLLCFLCVILFASVLN